MRKNNQNGSSMLTTPIVFAIGIIMISTLIVFSVKILMPYIWYEKLSSSCIKYIFVMEEYGYLTRKEAKALKDDLIKQGFDEDKLMLSYVSTRVDYGKPIFLKIVYDYDINFPIVGKRTIEMKVERHSVSKR